MHATNLDGAFRPEDPPPRIASGHHEDATPGVLLAWGPPFRSAGSSIDALRANDLPEVGAIQDLLPTLLALCGVTVGTDLQGRVLTDLMEPSVEFEYGPPADFERWIERRTPHTFPDDVENTRLEQLRSLGYVE
jgi:hypothetical protein